MLRQGQVTLQLRPLGQAWHGEAEYQRTEEEPPEACWILRQPDTSSSWKEVNSLVCRMGLEPEPWASRSKKNRQDRGREREPLTRFYFVAECLWVGGRGYALCL